MDSKEPWLHWELLRIQMLDTICTYTEYCYPDNSLIKLWTYLQYNHNWTSNTTVLSAGEIRDGVWEPISLGFLEQRDATKMHATQKASSILLNNYGQGLLDIHNEYMFTWQRKKIDFNYCVYLAIENYRVTSKKTTHTVQILCLWLLLLIVPASGASHQHLTVLLVLDFFTLVHL